MSLPLSGPVETFKTFLSYALNPIAYHGEKGAARLAKVPANIGRLVTAEVRNQQLQEELKALALLRAESDVLRKENERLRHALSLKLPEGRTGVWAHVMERDPLHWYQSVTVDAGEEDGVALNAPVLGQWGDGLVALGRIVETGPKTSKILLLTDEGSSAAAYLSSGTIEGLVQGQGTDRLRMNYIHSEAVLTENDLVYTSRTSVTFPPEILIGKVSQLLPANPFLTFLSVEVKPAADASSFSEVLILKNVPHLHAEAGK
jgi:rod shape-determining protein MreC